MIKILNGFDWLECEIGSPTKEIIECIEKGLLKYTDGEDRPQFIVLESNINAVKEIMGDDYYKLDEESLMPWLNEELRDCGRELEIENAFSDKIVINSYEIYDLINNEEIAITDKEKQSIYDSGSPTLEMWRLVTKIGKEQLKIRIMDLLSSLDNCYNEFE